MKKETPKDPEEKSPEVESRPANGLNQFRIKQNMKLAPLSPPTNEATGTEQGQALPSSVNTGSKVAARSKCRRKSIIFKILGGPWPPWPPH